MSEQRRMPSFDDPPPENHWKATPKTAAPSPSASTTGSDAKTNRTPLIVGAVALGLAAIVGIAMTVAIRGSSTPPSDSRQQTQELDDESNSGPSVSADEPAAVHLARSYSGVMHGGYGDATFRMKLHEAQGHIQGEVVWDHTAGAGGGYAGTQYVKGSRDGHNLALKALGWSADTAADWSDEFYTYDLTFRDDRLTHFTGSMLCRVCGTGERVIEGAAS